MSFKHDLHCSSNRKEQKKKQILNSILLFLVVPPFFCIFFGNYFSRVCFFIFIVRALIILCQRRSIRIVSSWILLACMHAYIGKTNDNNSISISVQEWLKIYIFCFVCYLMDFVGLIVVISLSLDVVLRCVKFIWRWNWRIKWI